MTSGLVRGVVFLGAALGVSSAFAAAGDTSAAVNAISQNVTYSSAATAKAKALNSYIGYTATVSNSGGNTINNIVFEGTLTVADPGEQPELSSWEGIASCVTVPVPNAPINQVTIQCPVGQVRAGATTPVFAVFFKAPIKDPVSPLPQGDDTVTFAGRIITAEGTNFPDPTNDSVDLWGPAPVVTLGTANNFTVKSAVPKSGGSFFTGLGGISLSGDPFTTTVTVPPLTTFTSAVIDETPLTCTSGKFVTCSESSLTIPGTFSPYLTVILRQDATNIVRGTKIETVLIKYTDDITNQVTYPVPDCIGGAPTGTGVPCILKRTYYKNKGVLGWTADLDGDFQWELINTKNGRFGLE
ncbi:MAG TPA: hypothetical protein VFX81_01285 [Burkholderiaceae bacterium]|nr:hypothetical protein [Burkholderiaceae bacterium]